MQRWVVASGDDGTDYSYNSSTARALGQTESQIQTDIRATGGDFANVIVKGISAAYVPGAGFIVSGAGSTNANGTYTANGTEGGYTKYTKPASAFIIAKVSDYWRIYDPSGAGEYDLYVTYDAGPDANTPPTTGWGQGVFGALPNPTVSTPPGTGGTAYYNIYFPYSVGNVAQGSAAGTGSTASTVYAYQADPTEIAQSTITGGGGGLHRYNGAYGVPLLTDADVPDLSVYNSFENEGLVYKNSAGTKINIIDRRLVSTISGNTTAGATTYAEYVYLCSATLTLTLPTAVANNGAYTIKNTGTGTITVATTSSQTIDGGSTAVLNTQYESITVVSDNANWVVI
jgi:hypothetical protein